MANEKEPEAEFTLPQEGHGLSLNYAVLAFISTLIGAGILGAPFIFYQFGILCGIVIMIFFAVLQSNTLRLLLYSKDLLPGKPESMFEIGYLLFQRKSIFVISTVLVLYSLGLIIAYLVVLS